MILSKDVWFDPDRYFLVNLSMILFEMTLIVFQVTFHIWTITYLILFLLRSKHFHMFGLGPLIGLIFSKQIKKFINDPRPENSCRSDFGMPSSHASFLVAVLCNLIG